jgi:DNA-binding NarL/FixJ family response regulator
LQLQRAKMETNEQKSKPVKKIHRKGDPLSKREIQIVELICQDLGNVEIGEKLGISYRTVEGFRRIINTKIGARSGVGVAVYALRNKIVSLRGLKTAKTQKIASVDESVIKFIINE